MAVIAVAGVVSIVLGLLALFLWLRVKELETQLEDR